MNAARLYQRQALWVHLPLGLVSLLAFFALSHLWLPLPPTQLTLSAGRLGGMYQEHAHIYATALQAHGLSLRVLESAGAGENLQRLKAADNSVQIGFAQGGYAQSDRALHSSDGVALQTLAQVDIEPIWVFSRLPEMDSLLQLQGKRVSIGPVGSGSRLVALNMLEQMRLLPKDLVVSEVAGMDMVNALKSGKLDASIFVASVQAPVVQALLASPGIYLASLKRSAALSERMPYLDARFAAAGSFGLTGKRLQPEKDMILLSTLASVVVREDLHPMVKRLIMHVIMGHHSQAGPLHRSHEFPHLKRLEFPSSPESRETLREDLPWLHQHLNLVQVQWVQRLLMIGLPLMLLAWLMARTIPSYLMWRINSRINRWYGELKFIENDLEKGLAGGLETAQFRARLRLISAQVLEFPMPRNYLQRQFVLQQHIALVQGKLKSRLGR